MTSHHHASASKIGQRSSSPNSSNSASKTGPINPFRLSESPHHQSRPHYRIDYPDHQVGLRILNSFPDNHEPKPFYGVLVGQPSNSNANNMEVEAQIKTNNMNPIPPPPPPLPLPPLFGDTAVYGVGGPTLYPNQHIGPNYAIQGSIMSPSQIISGLPFPKTTYNFGDSRVLGNTHHCHPYHHPYKFVANFPKGNSASSDYNPPDQFLRICYTCKRKLSPGKDIYIYRGDSSFCSEECRYKEILAEKNMAENANKSPRSSPTTSSKNGAIFFLPFAT